MSLGRLMLDLSGETLLEEEHALVLHPDVGGIIFFARNFSSVEQISELVKSIRSLRQDILLCVDQEGGRVQRFKEGFTRLPAMLEISDYAAETGNSEILVDTGWLMAVEVLACGVDFSFAPVLDIDRDHCEVIANRSFGDNSGTVISSVESFIEGMHQAGMAATGKHFPGHGGVKADSHLATPYDHRTFQQLLECDIKPFAALANKLEAIMPAHIMFPEIDSQAVGFSRYWLQDVLRGRLGFNGVIFSDDLSMKGADVAGGYVDKTRSALDAGCDMVLVCNNRDGALEVLEFLEKEKLPLSKRLSSMMAKKQWLWPEIKKTKRWQQTRERLATI